MARMRLENLVFRGRHGVEKWEKEEYQRFQIDLKLSINIEESVETDELRDTVDWFQLKYTVKRIVTNEQFNLVETLTERIAKAMLDNQRVNQVKVEVTKLDIWDNGKPSITIKKRKNEV